MARDIAIELVLMEDEEDGDELYVLDWEFDSASNKMLYLKLFPIEAWLNGRHGHPEYIIMKSDLILYARDDSGYISTSNRLNSSRDNGKFFDEYGRPYTRCDNGRSLGDLKLQLVYKSVLQELGEVEVKRRIKVGESI
ncbi:MAG: hypothetical protein SWK76_00360 [Actinomycetota bacterium]|nr:hypothetical protein [Actinomycetota bacterium]